MSSQRHRVVPTLTEVLDAQTIGASGAALGESGEGDGLGSAWADSEILERTDHSPQDTPPALAAESWPDLGIGSAELVAPPPSIDPPGHPVIGAHLRHPKPPAASELLMQRLDLRLTALVDGLVDELLAEQAQARLRQQLEQVIQQWVAEVSLQLAPVLEQRLQQLLRETLESPGR